MRIGKNMFYDSVTVVRGRIRDAIKKAIAFWVIDRMSQVAFLFMAKRFAIAYEKLKVSGVRLVDMRIVNLVHDAMAQREPSTATGVVRCSHAFFGAGSPTRLNSRCSKCD